MDQTHESKCKLGPRIVSLPSWLEDCTELYVQLIRNPAGLGFPDEDTPETRMQTSRESVRVSDLGRVLDEHAQENIWRSWQLFSDELCSNAVSYVPLLLDIDNEDNNLEGAYVLTRACLDLLEGIDQYHTPDRLRVVFSGMKGFHVEARPTVLVDNRSFRDTVLSELEKAGLQHIGATNCFFNSVIDPCHDFIRLTGSFNSWEEEKIVKRRKVIQLTVEEFRKSQTEDIVARAEAA